MSLGAQLVVAELEYGGLVQGPPSKRRRDSADGGSNQILEVAVAGAEVGLSE